MSNHSRAFPHHFLSSHSTPGSAGLPTRIMSRRLFVTGMLTASTISLAGCWIDPASPENRPEGQIRIGSAMFPESEIIARIWALTLKNNGYDVHVIPQIGSRDVYLAALEEGSVDVVPEYSGNLYAHYADLPQGISGDALLDSLVKVLPKELIALPAAAAESKDSYRVTREQAERRNLTTLGDLVPWAESEGVIIGAAPELSQRFYGPTGLHEVYGLPLDGIEVRAYGDSGGPLTIRALVDGAVDLADVYTTTPTSLPDGSPADLVTLEDPEMLIPPQNVVPLARKGAFDDRAVNLIAEVNNRLRTSDLEKMNMRSSGEEKASADRIAREWLNTRRN